ncbi:excinuclease ABC subunit UvrC [Natroniella acetigena]|uniref:excinuclease ABC subunit UvrC n=1 Tax=Natroniella acetigena TaxID=52004 RepID=UPI0024A7B34B|nr:excinuclease ABC subunit UvrC [Natroniella acetigena]MCK8828193.1 excinuclease ABC subunit UvrC [Natroniella acetigena]
MFYRGVIKINLKVKAKNLPCEPGVYLMKDQTCQIIYVGKAKSLRKRVKSYWQSSKQRFKTKVLVDRIADFEYIVTDTEVEALILENNLIKKYNPKFNIQLKDDKTYPYIKVTIVEVYPRVYKTRIVKNDGSRYFGPYTDVKAVNDLLELVADLFSLRDCKRDLTTDKEERACLNYHIEKCHAPCINEISQTEYNELIAQVIMILEGKEENLVEQLEVKMEQAAKGLEFETAAKLRDQIKAINKVTQKQKVVAEKLVNQDIIALATEDNDICLQLLIVRSGRLIGKEDFIFADSNDFIEVVTAFLQQYYDQVYYIPEEILLEFMIDDLPVIEEWLQHKKGAKLEVKVPQQGQKKRLVDLAARNARYNLKEYRFKEKFSSQQLDKGVKQLQQELGLKQPPVRIEGFDISNLQGTDTVASLVSFQNGQPYKKGYRRFKIKTVQGQDDFAAMNEVVQRRYSRLVEEGREFPDLILIDGGKGQLNSALKVLDELGQKGQQIISLAKREEEVFVPGKEEAVRLSRNSAGLYLLQRVRDEAHRFAVSYHRKLRGRRLTHSMLDDIPGIGPKRRKALLQHFGSLEKIKTASVEELVNVKGISNNLATGIKDYLQHHLRP